MTVLGVDHGAKRIGIAVSDSTESLARPLTILKHISRAEDVLRVARLATQHEVERIVVGQSMDEDGNPNAAGRSAARFAEALAGVTGRRVILWDESLSTHDARALRAGSGASRKRRAAEDDALAAAVILRSFLDAMQVAKEKPGRMDGT
ncbi:MAG TPA: Holliday junction resolvase RuvX [Anaerolineales bacterium]